MSHLGQHSCNFRSSNKTLYPFENALTPSPSPKGRGEVLLEPLKKMHILWGGKIIDRLASCCILNLILIYQHFSYSNKTRQRLPEKEYPIILNDAPLSNWLS